MKVLIIKTSAMGDIIHALPVLDFLHQVSPGIAIDWVVEEQFKDILAGNPLLRRLHLIRTRKWRKKPFATETRLEIFSLRKELRTAKYDIVFDIQGNLKSGMIAWATGVDRVYGFSSDHLQESVNSLFLKHQVQIRPEDDHAGGRYMRIVSAAFGRDYRSLEISANIYTGPKDEQIAAETVPEFGRVPVFLFHGGTTWQTKFWSQDGWTKLGSLLHSEYPGSVILLSWGNEAEKTAAESVVEAVGGNVRLLDRYPLKGITAIIKRVNVVIGGDTGLIHLAAAVGTPTVSYYRASDGSVSGPRGNRHVIVQSPLSCTRCQRTSCDKDEQCRASISAEHIFAGVKKLLRGN
jgi:heptosyltransferase I